MRCERAKVTLVVGPNGCGKSTLLKTIVGLVPPISGRVWLGTDDVTGIRAERLAARGLTMVLQGRGTFPEMTVEENLRLGGRLLRRAALVSQRLEFVYARFGRLREKRSQPAGLLSGGEQRMLEFARALMLDPHVLLLDEPSAMLAPAFLEEIWDEIRRFTAAGTTVVLVEQNIRKALELADYVYVLDLGRNRFEGTPGAIAANGELATLYLGER